MSVLETERLQLRYLRPDDLDTMHAYLGDPKTMVHYPQPFSREFVKDGIEQNIARYLEYGYGLFTLCGFRLYSPHPITPNLRRCPKCISKLEKETV